MKQKISRKAVISIICGVVVLAAALAVLLTLGGERQITVGHSGGPMLGALYAADEDPQWQKSYETVRMGSSADVGYALLSGGIDAGFVEVSKLPALEKLAGFEDLTAVGEVSFPYGATMILRRDLSLKLSELNGHVVGISSPDCVLLAAVKNDAERLGIDLSDVAYKTVPFEDMISALEAGIVDAVVTKASYTVSARELGHKVLYQNWDVEAGDECCPAVIDQIQLVLLARQDSAAARQLPEQLLFYQKNTEPERLREATAKATVLPADLLADLPMAVFALADNTLIETLVGHSHPEGESHEDDEGEDVE